MESLLLIDRDRRTRKGLRALLSDAYEVRATHSIFEAFRLLRNHAFDCIVVRTADRDAYALALLQWLHKRWMPIPVVVLFGVHADTDADRLRRLGAADVMFWPGDADRLSAAVLTACPRHAAQDSGPVPKLRELWQTERSALAIVGRNGHRRRDAGRFRDEHERSWLRRGRLDQRYG